jgi:hypothetical protein
MDKPEIERLMAEGARLMAAAIQDHLRTEIRRAGNGTTTATILGDVVEWVRGEQLELDKTWEPDPRLLRGKGTRRG